MLCAKKMYRAVFPNVIKQNNNLTCIVPMDDTPPIIQTQTGYR